MGMSLEMILNICLVILIKAFELFIFSMITPVTNEKTNYFVHLLVG